MIRGKTYALNLESCLVLPPEAVAVGGIGRTEHGRMVEAGSRGTQVQRPADTKIRRRSTVQARLRT